MAPLLLVLLISMSAAHAWGAEVNEGAFEQGLRSSEGRAMGLIRQAAGSADKKARLELVDQALIMAPDLPVVYFKRATTSIPDVFTALNYMIDGMKAYKRNFWWRHSLEGLLTVAAMAGAYAALLGIIIARMGRDIPSLAHEMNERKYKLPLMLIPLGLAPLGPAAFLAGAMVLMGIYFKKMGKLPVYIALGLLGAAPVTHSAMNYYFSATSPETRAIVDVYEGKRNDSAIALLKYKEDFVSQFSYATALKRMGYYVEAEGVFDALRQEHPDPRVLTNMANAYVGAGNNEAAKALYETARKSGDPLVPTYNLGQVYRSELLYSKGDEFNAEASKMDTDRVSQFVTIAGLNPKNPNRLVIDETLARAEIVAHIKATRRDVVSLAPLEPIALSIVAIGLFFFFVVYDKLALNRAYNCANCQKVICRICTPDQKSGKHCADCHSMLNNPDDTSPKARVARMLEASKQREGARSRIRIVSFTIPGLAHVLIGKTMSGFMLLWLFFGMIFILVANPLFRTGMAGARHGWLDPVAIVVMLLLYVISVASISRRLEMGWL